MGNVDDLQARLKRWGVPFRDPSLLREALVHPSFANEHPEEAPRSNERLEFLGDALVGLVVAEELFRRFPQMEEGELTLLRSALVRGEALARLARTLNLGPFLLLGQGEEASGGRERTSVLAGALEALMGAVFLDRGYKGARAFLLRLLSPEVERYAREGPPKDPKSALQEALQGRGLPRPIYRTVSISGPDHRPSFTVEVLVGKEVWGKGSGRSKTEAEQDAARHALSRLHGEAG